MQTKASSRSWQWGMNPVCLNALRNLSITRNATFPGTQVKKNQNTDTTDSTFDRNIYHLSY